MSNYAASGYLGRICRLVCQNNPAIECPAGYLFVRIERLNNPCEIGSVVLKLDYINRMLLNLDVADDIVNTMSCLHETVLAIEAEGNSSVGQGYQTQ